MTQRGSTRRQALAAAAAALAARPGRALAKGTDRGPLAGVGAYQGAVAAEYGAALAEGAFGDAQRATLERFRAQALEAARSLREAVADEGGRAPAAADPGSIPAPRDWLRDVIRVEELAVAAYYAALQGLEHERNLRAAAAFMAQSGRRLVVLRQLAGEPLLPRAFETGAA